MTAVRKLTLGIQPENKAFRIGSMWGLIVDALVDARGKEISETFYTNISETQHNGLVSLTNEKEGNSLFVDRHNVTFIKAGYPMGGHVDLDKAYAEFMKVWSILQSVIKLSSIRRIGIVAEHRLDAAKNSSTELLEKLTTIQPKDISAKFMLHYESRVSPTGEKLDEKRGSFTNSIYDFYDSAHDQQYPAEGKINANFDYQRYYSPVLTTKFSDDIQKHFFEFKKERLKFEKELVKMKLVS